MSSADYIMRRWRQGVLAGPGESALGVRLNPIPPTWKRSLSLRERNDGGSDFVLSLKKRSRTVGRNVALIPHTFISHCYSTLLRVTERWGMSGRAKGDMREIPTWLDYLLRSQCDLDNLHFLANWSIFTLEEQDAISKSPLVCCRLGGGEAFRFTLLPKY